MSDPLITAWLARPLFDEIPEGIPRLEREEDDEGDAESLSSDDVLTAAAGGSHWKDELRIPKGNGKRSGQWTFTPWKHMDLVEQALKAFYATELLSPAQAVKWEKDVLPRIETARELLSGLDKDTAFWNDPNLKPTTEAMANLLHDANLTAGFFVIPGLKEAADKIREFGELDWTLFNEDTDIGLNDGTDENTSVVAPKPDIGAGDADWSAADTPTKKAKDLKVGDTILVFGIPTEVLHVNAYKDPWSYSDFVTVTLPTGGDENTQMTYGANDDVEVVPAPVLDPTDAAAVKAALEALPHGGTLDVGGWHVKAWQGQGKSRIYRAGYDPLFAAPETDAEWAYYGSAYTGAQGLSEQIAVDAAKAAPASAEPATKKAKDLKPGDKILADVLDGPTWIEISHINEDVDGDLYQIVGTDGSSVMYNGNEDVLFDDEAAIDGGTPAGTKKAKDLKPGDTVVTYDEDGNPYAVVLEDVQATTDTVTGEPMIEVSDEDGGSWNYSPEDDVEVTSTPAAEGTKKAKDLKPGDTVLIYDDDEGTSFAFEIEEVQVVPDVVTGEPVIQIGNTYNAWYFNPEEEVEVVQEAPTTEASPAEEPGIPDIGGWEKIGPAKGSNPGGTYVDMETGEQHYVKQSKSDLHARNEVLAARLYALAGVKTTDPSLVTHGAGQLGTAAKIVDGKQDLGQNLWNTSKLSDVGKGFAADAWLANWDVIGLSYDNVLTTPDDEPVRVDLGGSLLFRAQGGKKEFGNSVKEWDSLRDSKTNPQSAAVFGGMSPSDLKASAASLQGVTNEAIDAAVDDVFGDSDPATASKLKATLKARRDDVLKRAGLDVPSVAVEVGDKLSYDPPIPALGQPPLQVGDVVKKSPGGVDWYITSAVEQPSGWTYGVSTKPGGQKTGAAYSAASLWIKERAAVEGAVAASTQVVAPLANLVEVDVPIVGGDIKPGDKLLLEGSVLKKAGGKLVPSTGVNPTVAEVKVGPKWASVVTTTGQKLWVESGAAITARREVQPTVVDVPATSLKPGDVLKLTGPVLKKSGGKLVPAAGEAQGKHDAEPTIATVKSGPKWTEVVTSTGQRLWINSGDQVTVEHTPGLASPGATTPASGGSLKGKPAPVLPVEPVKPEAGVPGPKAYDDWLAKAKVRYANSPAAAKGALEDSNNWPRFQRAMSGEVIDALKAADELFERKYLDQALLDQIRQIYKDAAVLPPGTEAKYEKERAAWLAAKAHYEELLKKWQADNPTSLKGMDGAKVFASNSEGVKWANEFLPKAKPGSKNAIKKMKGSSSEINNVLWKGLTPTPSQKQTIDALDAAMQPVGTDIYLFRGTDMKEFEGIGSVEELKKAVGTVFQQKAFQPTGLGVDTAFSGSSVQIVYRVPAEAKGVWAMPVSPPPFTNEREFMLARNTRYIIHKVTQKDGKTWVEAEIIPAGFPDPTGQPPQVLTKKVGTYFSSRHGTMAVSNEGVS